MVPDVVATDGAQQASGGVDDRQGRQVVGGQQAGDGTDGVLGAHGVDVGVHDGADHALGALAQGPLEVDHAHELAGGGLQGRTAHEADGGQGGRDLGLTGLGQEAAHVLSLLGLHEPQQLGGLELGEFGDQVGGVVGLHGVQDVGGAPGLQAGQEGDGVLVAELLQDVGQALIGQLCGHAHLAVLGQVAHDVGQVGRLEVLQGGQQRGGALLVGAGGQAADLVGAHREGLPAAQAQRA